MFRQERLFKKEGRISFTKEEKEVIITTIIACTLSIAFLVFSHFMSNSYTEYDCKVYISSDNEAIALVYIDKPLFEKFVVKDSDMVNFIREHNGEFVKCKIHSELPMFLGYTNETTYEIISIYE